jgi:hypothetical protein
VAGYPAAGRMTESPSAAHCPTALCDVMKTDGATC